MSLCHLLLLAMAVLLHHLIFSGISPVWALWQVYLMSVLITVSKEKLREGFMGHTGGEEEKWD